MGDGGTAAVKSNGRRQPCTHTNHASHPTRRNYTTPATGPHVQLDAVHIGKYIKSCVEMFVMQISSVHLRIHPRTHMYTVTLYTAYLPAAVPTDMLA